LECEREFLVLSADTETFARLRAGFEPSDKLVARLDRRHIDLIARHAGDPVKMGRDHTRASRARANVGIVLSALPAMRPSFGTLVKKSYDVLARVAIMLRPSSARAHAQSRRPPKRKLMRLAFAAVCLAMLMGGCSIALDDS